VSLRHQEFVELCALCRDPARAACLRCATPLCERHAPRSGRRCGPCEEAYRDGLLRREAELADRWLARLDANRDFGRGNTYRRNNAMIAVGALGLVWVRTVAKWLWIGWGRPRRRFLAERKHQAALVTPGAPALPGDQP
jgi:hypothetical protein